MTRHLIFAAISFVMLTMMSCGGGSTYLPEATGAPFEVLVIATDSQWEGKLGDTLRSILLEPVMMLNQREPATDPHHIIPGKFKGLLLKYANIVNVSIDPEWAAASLSIQHDVSARNQQIINIIGPDLQSAIDYLSENRVEFLQAITIAERERHLQKIRLSPAKEVNQAVKETFGFDITIPKGYKINNRQDDFMWLELELKLADLGIIIYSYPYENRNDFSPDSLLSKRNQFVSRIPGPVDGSYMITAEFPPMVTYSRIHGRLWANMSGLWDVHGDYMGGPFRNYTTLDETTQRMVSIDLFVFAPNQRKRNYIRQLETIIRTVRFPGDNAGTESTAGTTGIVAEETAIVESNTGISENAAESVNGSGVNE